MARNTAYSPLVVWNVLKLTRTDDPQFKNSPAKHRDFLKQKARFTEVIPIRNRERLRMIHFTYRLEYVKDCVLAHLLDDGGLRLHTIVTFGST